MNAIPLITVALGILLVLEGKAQQASFKTEFIGNSGHWFLPNGDKPRERIGDSKGSSIVHQGTMRIPLSMKMNENKRPAAWACLLLLRIFLKSGSKICLEAQALFLSVT